MIWRNASCVSGNQTVCEYWTIQCAKGASEVLIVNILSCMAGCMGKETFPIETLIALTPSVLLVNSICALRSDEGCLLAKYMESCGADIEE